MIIYKKNDNNTMTIHSDACPYPASLVQHHTWSHPVLPRLDLKVLDVLQILYGLIR